MSAVNQTTSRAKQTTWAIAASTGRLARSRRSVLQYLKVPNLIQPPSADADVDRGGLLEETRRGKF